MSDACEEAHKEAKRRWPPEGSRAVMEERVLRRIGFEEGAHWAASRPVTDAEHDRQVAEAARRDALELLRAWAESDLERAQPKYGEYAEGLRNAQAIVRALIGGTE